MRDRRGNERTRRNETSYDEESRRRFGSGHGFFGFGAGGSGLSWVFLVFSLALVAVVVRLFMLQVLDGPRLSEMAEARRTSTIVLQARRGTIMDRNGNVLARSEECYDVFCNPQEIRAAEEEAEKQAASDTSQMTSPMAGDPRYSLSESMAYLLASHLGGDAQTYREQLDSDTTFAYLARQADKDACEALNEELASRKMSGIYLANQMRRVYPYGTLAGQVLGYVNVDGEGVTGLEYQYDEQLKGESGKMVLERGLYGTPIAGEVAQVEDPVDGQDLVLTLDIDVQRVVEENVVKGVTSAKATSGLAVVYDPRTGAIIAACSTPYADITDPDALTTEELNLKPISSAYEPGSIAKVLTAAIGLESGTVDTNTYYTVPMSVMVGDGIVFDVDDRTETMDMNLREMLRRSSNVGAALIAQESIGPQYLSSGFAAFGIGSPTGVDYPGEATGLVKSLAEYDASSVGSMSFGQGFSVPMIQMVRSVGAIACRGVMHTPHFVTSVGGKDLDWSAEQRATSELVAEKVADMMCTVVTDGTAQAAAVEGYEVAAKTGTGEIAENGKYLKKKFLASVIGFAPARDPEVLVYVGLNETPYLSYSSACPVFSAIMGEALSDLGVLS